MKKKPTIQIQSPGRICLFGDHQDYLNLPVIACAIDRFITLKATVNHQGVFRIHLPDTQSRRQVALDAYESEFERDYLVSALRVLRKKGIVCTQAYDVEISGNIPINAGLSSSSALVVGWLRFLCEAAGHSVSAFELAQLAYETEVLEFNEPGGLMDQYTISMGEVIYIDTEPPSAYQILSDRLPGLIVGESGIPKQTLGVLGSLRAKAQEAVSIVRQYHPDFLLKEAKVKDIARYQDVLPGNLKAVFSAAIENHSITQAAVKTFRETPLDIKKLGHLMNQHHEVLRDKLKITVPLIDKMVDAALDAGAYGAKIVGSGGGGSIVALSSAGCHQDVIAAISRIGKAAYGVEVSKGAWTI
ncbi:MAG: galactokinase family protein [Flavobacteriaceae bacterium]|nr:galactokinase family protein [Flavobacteriaceae bacterium]